MAKKKKSGLVQQALQKSQVQAKVEEKDKDNVSLRFFSLLSFSFLREREGYVAVILW